MSENETKAGHNTYLPGYSTVAHHEWRTVENTAAYLLPRLQTLASQNPNLQILDVGCGSGTITASLVSYLPANGHITAIDLSPEIVSRASAHAQKLGPAISDKITFTPASVYTLSQTLLKGTFDIVHTSQMLVHLDSPISALREMLSMLKPGGLLAVREIDMRVWSCYPDTETMRAWHRVQLATHEASGGSNAAGPSLVAWAMKAGAKRRDIEASMGAWMYSTEDERRVWGEWLAFCSS
jgi:2-polyprenyl-3-methyl-5-hydroxy-6-metoxy-1,4-benzoquinol methylase